MSHPEVHEPQVERRRDRLRNATLAEIKERAWSQLAEEGAALSLRGIARSMGMTSSAIYRYFASREELLSALAVDGFTSLADALEEVEGEIDDSGADGPERWLRTSGAYRRWALEHSTAYALIFGSLVPGFRSDEEAKVELVRGVSVLLRTMVRSLAEGSMAVEQFEEEMSPRLRAQFEDWARAGGMNLPPGALAGCMFSWIHLHGAISLELFGHYPEALRPPDELFEHQMRLLLASLGFPRGEGRR